MPTLKPEQIAAAAHEAGFRGNSLVEIVAVALAESGGNPQALNPNGERSVGLTQVNIDPSTSWGRARARKYGGERGLYDPVTNMKAAFDISQGGKSFRPWSVHSSSPSPHAGAYRQYLRVARQAAGVATGTEVPRGSGGGGDTSAPRARFDNLPGGGEGPGAEQDAAVTAASALGEPVTPPEQQQATSGTLNGLWTHMMSSMSNQIRQGSGEQPTALLDALRTLGLPADETPLDSDVEPPRRATTRMSADAHAANAGLPTPGL